MFKMYKYYSIFIIVSFYSVFAVPDPQDPEINDQFETNLVVNFNDTKPLNITIKDLSETPNPIVMTKTKEKDSSISRTIVEYIKAPFIRIIALPKIYTVLRDIGTCIVNGVMEVVSFYAPAPLIPLIATAAGMVIPFEPVVMLREKMPVNSYRRAFKLAMDSFMGTFDKYKSNTEDDPYMTRRFNRRFMNEPNKKTTEFTKYDD